MALVSRARAHISILCRSRSRSTHFSLARALFQLCSSGRSSCLASTMMQLSTIFTFRSPGLKWLTFKLTCKNITMSNIFVYIWTARPFVSIDFHWSCLWPHSIPNLPISATVSRKQLVQKLGETGSSSSRWVVERVSARGKNPPRRIPFQRFDEQPKRTLHLVERVVNPSENGHFSHSSVTFRNSRL